MPEWWTGPSPAQRRAQARIAAELGALGFALPGSVTTRSYRCGKGNCACHGDPPRLHGPYIQWSRVQQGKTVHTNLSDDQITDYQDWLDNGRRLKQLVEALEALTIDIVNADPRLNHSPRSSK